ncbi:RHS repeat-associated core domain-containing protein [Pseudomonas peradeniyensis]|uniref:RHS repeat-associated core domain-containing protein n=1 Tax=Pseudomonas peradeniyensis TaxID=2745488 RepID=UPI003F5AAA2E
MNNIESGTTQGLIATDQQMSVVHRWHRAVRMIAYSPYGASPLAEQLGFTGQRLEQSGVYLLGNGYRAYNPVLMRFQSPDSSSPFGEGGVSAYGYCEGDPVNYADRNGHEPFKPLLDKNTWLSLDPVLFQKAKALYKDWVRHDKKVARLEEHSRYLLERPEERINFTGVNTWRTWTDEHLMSMQAHLKFREEKQEPKLEARREALVKEMGSNPEVVGLYWTAIVYRKAFRELYGPTPGQKSAILFFVRDLAASIRGVVI